MSEKLAAIRKEKFEGITQVQIHVRRKDGTLTPSKPFLTSAGKELREKGILFQVLTWGADDEGTYRELLEAGVASFATDFPEVTLKAVRAHYEKDFKITLKEDEDRVTVITEQDRTVFDIKSPRGVSTAVIERQGEKWPEAVVVRMHLAALEQFRAKSENVVLSASVLSHTDYSTRLSVDKTKEDPKDPKSLYFMDFKMVGKDGKPATTIPLKGGYFELKLPKPFFEGNPKSFKLEWIDWYRR